MTKTLFGTMYRKETVATASHQPQVPSGKVNTVCDAMRAALERVDASKYLLCILTALVRKNPPALEEALLLIRQLKSKASH